MLIETQPQSVMLVYVKKSFNPQSGRRNICVREKNIKQIPFFCFTIGDIIWRYFSVKNAVLINLEFYFF